MISFTQLLDGLQIRLKPFAICEIRSGAGLSLKDELPHIHYVLRGRATVRRAGSEDIPLDTHHVLILPVGVEIKIVAGGGSDYVLPEPRCRAIPGGWDWIDVGEGVPAAVLACGKIEATHQGALGLFDHLRDPLAESMAGEPAFNDPINLLLTELAFPKPGTAVLAATLMKQCLIVLLRRYWQDEERPAPWLAALREPQLIEVIEAVRERPEAPHSLEGLARIAGMSRAAFAERFKRAFGRPPMDYVKEMRLRRAAELLTATDLPVQTIAQRVGFESRSYFTRAFHAFSGQHPSQYRSAGGAGADAPRQG